MPLDAIKKTFAKNLAQQLNEHDLSQADFRDELNQRYDTSVSKASVSQWLSGKDFPRAQVLQSIADFFDKPPAWFLESTHSKKIGIGLADQPQTIDEAHRKAMGRVRDLPAAKLPALNAFLDALEAT